jgi:hypothetical protein
VLRGHVGNGPVWITRGRVRDRPEPSLKLESAREQLGEYGEARIVKHIDSIRETVLESFCHLGKQLRTKLDPDAEGDTRVLK